MITNVYTESVTDYSCFPPAFEIWTAAEVVNDYVKGRNFLITFWRSDVYIQNKFLYLAPFPTLFTTSAATFQNIWISPPHFEIENVNDYLIG